MNHPRLLGLARDPRLPSDLTLERLLARELSPEDEARVRAQLAACPDGEALLERKQAEWEQVSSAAKLRMLKGIQTQLHTKDRWRRLWSWVAQSRPLYALPAMALAALGLLVLIGDGSDPEVRTKGAARLRVYRERGGQVELARPREVFRAGDRVRVATTLPTSKYVLVYGREASGLLFPVYPNGSEASSLQALPAGAHDPLPGAVELDGSTGEESFVLAACEAPLALEQLRGDEAGALEAAACEVVNFPLRKER